MGALGKFTREAALLPYLVSLVEDGLARFDASWTTITNIGPALVADGGHEMGSVVAWRRETAVQFIGRNAEGRGVE